MDNRGGVNELDAYLKDHISHLRDKEKSESTVTEKEQICRNLVE